MRRWGATPSQSVMVGDYIHDIRAGNAAGMKTVLVKGVRIPRRM